MTAPFGLMPDGRPVEALTLSAGPLTARLLTLGATVQDLRLEGVGHPLVLGAPDVAGYLGPARYVGAIVGRLANRLGGARFTLDGRGHRTDPNWLCRHTLHGGDDGADRHLWRIEAEATDRAALSLDLPDGHMGFPGRIALRAEISVTHDALRLDLTAQADAPTPCSLAHHGYFDLDGRGDIRGHRLRVQADHYLPVDDDLIPTGEIAPVEGTRFDFRAGRQIGEGGYDHNLCLSDGPRPLRPVAMLTGESGLSLGVETTACGMQVYDGAHFDAVAGLEGRCYGPRAGIALETQGWPDAPNRPAFPPAILRPGEVYRETTIYRIIP